MKARTIRYAGAVALCAAGLAACGTPQTKSSEPQLLGTPPKPSEDPFYYLARPPVEAVAETSGTIGEVSPAPPATVEETVEDTAEEVVEPPTKTVREVVQDPALLERLSSESAARQAAEAELALAVSRLEQARAENELLQRNFAEAERSLARSTSAEEASRRALLAAKQDLESAQQTLRSTEQSLISTQRALENERKKPGKAVASATAQPPAQPAQPSCHACVRICPDKGACRKDAEVVCGWGTGKDRQAASQRARAECDGALELMRGSGAYSRVSGQCPVATCQ